MKIMYMARFGRFDLLRAIGSLASRLTKWDKLCDRKLWRIIQYLAGTKHWKQIGFVGDSTKDLELGLFTDADFAGDRSDMKSTSGVFLALYGPLTFFPLGAQSKKQSAVSHSTAESEIVACDHGLRTEGLPALPRWKIILGKTTNFATVCRQPSHNDDHEDR